jgi:hypothetical protein
MIIPKLLEQIIGVVAGSLTILTQGTYFVALLRGKVKPSVLSWFGWALLMGVSFYSQLESTGWQWSQTSLIVSSIACLIIPTSAILLGSYSLVKKDWIFLILGTVCIYIYLKSKDPWATTVYAISADFLLAFPTFIKAYKKPQSEKTIAWYFGLISWSLSLIICINHDLLYALFPIYLFLFNLVMIILTRRA